MDYFGEPCKCFEDNIRYMDHRVRNGAAISYQISRAACRDSCQDNVDCYYWSWAKSGIASGECNLKMSLGREKIIPTQNYVSGSRYCKLPEDTGKGRFHKKNVKIGGKLMETPPPVNGGWCRTFLLKNFLQNTLIWR